MTIRICRCKIFPCTPRCCVLLTCVLAFLFVTVNVITIHSYQTVSEVNNPSPLHLSQLVDSIQLPSLTQTNTPHDIITNHQSRKTLILAERHAQSTLPSIFGGSFDPFNYIQSQRSHYNGTVEDPFKQHYFNQTASDKIGYKRPLWDTRNEKCKRMYSTSINTSVSVIICFHNEARSALLRTIHSVLDKTPDSILKEIILIDDSSDDAEDGYQLKSIPKVKLIRLDDRQGLIRARLIGVKNAQSDILLFLDSHCEASTGWIQPLVTRILKCRECIVSPVIDIINKNSMTYITSQVNIKGGFDHSLFFKWVKLNPKDIEKRRIDIIAPISTPAIAGGLFAVDKSFFIELGAYDEDMDIWGGENIELSMRTWMCGGQLEIMPCSRVGHIFRSTMPYTFGKGKTYLSTVVKNLCRTAEVWMDASKSAFYSEMPMARKVDFGNITDRQILRKKLHCRSFQWFIDNIYPEFITNYTTPNYVQLAQYKRKCISIVKDRVSGSRHIQLKHCELVVMGPSSDQIWELTSDGQIKHSSNSCLTAGNPPSSLQPNTTVDISIEDCIQEHRQLFTVREPVSGDNQHTIVHTLSQLCVGVPATTSTVRLINCTLSDLKWSFRKLL